MSLNSIQIEGRRVPIDPSKLKPTKVEVKFLPQRLVAPLWARLLRLREQLSEQRASALKKSTP